MGLLRPPAGAQRYRLVRWHYLHRLSEEEVRMSIDRMRFVLRFLLPDDDRVPTLACTIGVARVALWRNWPPREWWWRVRGGFPRLTRAARP